MIYLYLALAIVTEVIATSSLKSCEGFTRLWPSLVVAAGYIASFFFLLFAKGSYANMHTADFGDATRGVR